MLTSFEEGHRIWRHRYTRATRRAARKRQKYARKIERMMARARSDSLVADAPDLDTDPRQWIWSDLASCGPVELHEHPPPSAAVGRHDTRDSIALLDLSLRRRKARRADGTAAPLTQVQSISHLRDHDMPPQYSVAEGAPGPPSAPIAQRFALWKRAYLLTAFLGLHRSTEEP